MAFRETTGEQEIFDGIFASRPENKTLRQINAMVDWRRLREVLAPAYDDSGVGKPGYDPVVPAKMLLLESLYGLSDVEAAAESADRLSFREFLGVTAGECVPDDTTLVRFRARLRAHGLMDAVESFFRAELSRRGLALRPGAIRVVDATLVPAATRPPQKPQPPEAANDKAESAAPGAQKSAQERRDGEAAFTSRKGRPFFGYKLHVARDATTGIVDAAEVTPANVHDSQVFETLLAGDERAVLADKAYDAQPRRERLEKRGTMAGILHKGRRGAPLAGWQRKLNRLYSRLRGCVETTIAILKRWRRCGRAVYLGLERVRDQMRWGIAAHNLMTAARLMDKCARKG